MYVVLGGRTLVGRHSWNSHVHTVLVSRNLLIQGIFRARRSCGVSPPAPRPVDRYHLQTVAVLDHPFSRSAAERHKIEKNCQYKILNRRLRSLQNRLTNTHIQNRMICWWLLAFLLRMSHIQRRPELQLLPHRLQFPLRGVASAPFRQRPPETDRTATTSFHLFVKSREMTKAVRKK